MRQLIIISTFLLLISCGKEESIQCTKIFYNSPFSAMVGERYCINEENYIEIDSVENQLCPCDVICIWEGEFILKLNVKADGKDFVYNMGTSPNSPDVQPFDQFMIKFLSISPEKCDSENQAEFKVGLLLEK